MISDGHQISEKLSFSQIECYIKNNELHKLGRSVHQRSEYHKAMDMVRLDFYSIYDYILINKFHCNIEYCDCNRKVAVRGSIAMPIVCALNDFPYFFEDNVVHYILWKIGEEAIKYDEIQNAIHHLKLQYGICKHKILGSTFFMNPIELKSIPEINHMHIVLHLDYNSSSPKPSTCC